MSEENLEMTDHYVAFLDIMGYSNAIDTVNEDEMSIFLNKMFQLIELVRKEALDISSVTDNLSLKLEEFQPKIKLFSDNILISVECTDDSVKNLDIYLTLCRIVIRLQAVSLSSFNFLMRGGISKGKFIQTEHFVFGPALVESARLEKKANCPRVMVKKSDIDELKVTLDKLENSGQNRRFYNHIVKDENCYFLNFLMGIFLNVDLMPDNPIDVFNHFYKPQYLIGENASEQEDNFFTLDMFAKFKEAIVTQLVYYNNYDKLSEKYDLDIREKLIERLFWLSKYFDSCCFSREYTVHLMNNAVKTKDKKTSRTILKPCKSEEEEP